MPKVSADVPQELLEDVQEHVGDDAKFVSVSDAIRSSLRKMLDQMEEVDRRRGRLDEVEGGEAGGAGAGIGDAEEGDA